MRESQLTSVALPAFKSAKHYFVSSISKATDISYLGKKSSINGIRVIWPYQHYL
jgi:hypothetical protein